MQSHVLNSLLVPLATFLTQPTNCTFAAQGFFIQIGTISCFTNVSLAVYYLLAIKHGMSEWKLIRYRPLLLACPILVGLAFAFGGKSEPLFAKSLVIRFQV